MAIMMTTSYQLISTIYLTYGQVRTYARYGSQRSDLNQTYWQVKCTYYTGQAYGVSFSSGRAGLDGSWRNYGSTTMPYGETTLIEEYRTTDHYQDGTSPNRSVPTAWSATFGGSGSTSVDIVFPKINRKAELTSAPNFTDEDSPTIQYYVPNKSISSLQARIENGAGSGVVEYITYRDIDINGTSYTFNFTEEERQHLRELTPNSNSLAVRFVVKTVLNGQTFWSTANRTMTIVNGNPTFTNSEIETTQKVIDVIGSSSADTVVQNASVMQMTVVPTALKSSTIASVRVANGTDYTETKTESPYVFNIPISTASSVVTVTDSRGNQSARVVSKTLIEYQNMDITSYLFERQNPTSANIDLTLEARYYQITVGSTVNAPVVKWKLEEDGTYATIPSSAYNIDTTNNKLTINSYELTDVLNHELSGQFYLKIEDIFSSDEDNMIVNKGIATYEAGEFDLQVNGDLIIADTNAENGINVKEKLTRKVATAYVNGNISAPSNAKISMGGIISNTSDLTLNSGGIRIGAGINHVLVSGNVFLQANANNSYLWTRIQKDGDTLSTAIDNYNTYFASTSHSPKLVAVSEGNILFIHKIDTASGTIRGYDNTYITVEVID